VVDFGVVVAVDTVVVVGVEVFVGVLVVVSVVLVVAVAGVEGVVVVGDVWRSSAAGRRIPGIGGLGGRVGRGVIGSPAVGGVVCVVLLDGVTVLCSAILVEGVEVVVSGAGFG